MPTIRPTKRLLMPTDPRQKAIIEAVIDDQSELWGMSNSDAILRDILDSHLPTGDFARRHAESVFSNEESLLAGAASTLRDVIICCVNRENAKDIVAFALELMNAKRLTSAIDTRHPSAHHMRGRFAAVVEMLKLRVQSLDAVDGYDLRRLAAYGDDLLVESDPDRYASAPAFAMVKYYLDLPGDISKSDDAISYVADAVQIVADAEASPSNGAATPPDNARFRERWCEVLGAINEGNA